MMQSSPVLSLSPSCTSYSSSRLAEIAARVVEEFRDQDEFDESFSSFYANISVDNGFHEELKNEKEEKIEKVEDAGDNGQEEEEEEEDGDEEFEFAFVANDLISSPTPADEIFYDGQIRPIYPVFDTSLLYDAVERRKENDNLGYHESMQKPPAVPESIRLPLRKLFIEEREPPSSCSSSEADELEGVASGTYCVWTPKAVDRHCKKSNSTGSSKRWRFRDLLRSSSSDGKERFFFLTHSNSHTATNAKKREEKAEIFDKTGVTSAKVADKITAAQCGKNGCERRRASFLPYRQDSVGFFSNVNGWSRNLHRF